MNFCWPTLLHLHDEQDTHISFHYVTFMKTMERSSHIVFMKTIKKQKWTPLPKKKVHYLEVCCVKLMSKWTLTLKVKMKTYFYCCSPSNIFQEYQCGYLSNMHSSFLWCDSAIIHISFLFYKHVKRWRKVPKKIVGYGTSVGIYIFHLCNYIHLTLIPFKYPRLNWIVWTPKCD